MNKINDFPKKYLNILFDCWGKGKNTKERLNLIKDNLLDVDILLALKTMRFMSKNNKKWIDFIKEKKKNQEIEKKNKQEIKKKKRQEKEKKIIEKNKKDFIQKNINLDMKNDLEKIISTKMFFCTVINQYINDLSCIYRIYDVDLFNNNCSNCKHMDKYISILEDFLNGREIKE